MLRASKHICELIRIDGRLVEMTTVRDEEGQVLERSLRPSSLEVYVHDFMQMIVGATLLAVPMGFTQETWDLGRTMSGLQIVALVTLSLVFMSMFIYYTSYRGVHFREHIDEFVKRLLATYILSFIVAIILLSVIGKAPFSMDALLAFKRAAIVAFPASLSAAVADTLK